MLLSTSMDVDNVISSIKTALASPSNAASRLRHCVGSQDIQSVTEVLSGFADANNGTSLVDALHNKFPQNKRTQEITTSLMSFFQTLFGTVNRGDVQGLGLEQVHKYRNLCLWFDQVIKIPPDDTKLLPRALKLTDTERKDTLLNPDASSEAINSALVGIERPKGYLDILRRIPFGWIHGQCNRTERDTAAQTLFRNLFKAQLDEKAKLAIFYSILNVEEKGDDKVITPELLDTLFADLGAAPADLLEYICIQGLPKNLSPAVLRSFVDQRDHEALQSDKTSARLLYYIARDVGIEQAKQFLRAGKPELDAKALSMLHTFDRQNFISQTGMLSLFESLNDLQLAAKLTSTETLYTLRQKLGGPISPQTATGLVKILRPESSGPSEINQFVSSCFRNNAENIKEFAKLLFEAKVSPDDTGWLRYSYDFRKQVLQDSAFQKDLKNEIHSELVSQLYTELKKYFTVNEISDLSSDSKISNSLRLKLLQDPEFQDTKKKLEVIAYMSNEFCANNRVYLFEQAVKLNSPPMLTALFKKGLRTDGLARELKTQIDALTGKSN